MAATLMFYRSRDSEISPSYFGAVRDTEPHGLHYQMSVDTAGNLDPAAWRVQSLSLEQVYRLGETHAPFEEPWPIEQLEFLHLLKRYILPPFALADA